MQTKRRHSSFSPSSFLSSLYSSGRFDRFSVHCLATQKTLDEKKYASVDELKRDVFALFDQGGFNDYNAIITFHRAEDEEVLMETLPPPLPKGQYRDLFIRVVSRSFVAHGHEVSLSLSYRSIRPVRCARVPSAFWTTSYCSNAQRTSVVSSIARSA